MRAEEGRGFDFFHPLPVSPGLPQVPLQEGMSLDFLIIVNLPLWKPGPSCLRGPGSVLRARLGQIPALPARPLSQV